MAARPHNPTLLEGGRQWCVPGLEGLKETIRNGAEEQEVFDPMSDEVESARKPFFETLEDMKPGFRLHSILLLLVVPVSFALTHYGGLRGMYAAYTMLPVVLLVSGTLQAHAYKELRSSWERVPAWAHGKLGAAFTKFEGRYTLPLIGLSLPFAYASVATWLALPEAIDPLLDGVTAGSAGSLLDKDAAAAFSASWQGKAGIAGSTIASWGIEGTLIRIVFAATAIQLWPQLYPFTRPCFMRNFPATFRVLDSSKNLLGFGEGDEALMAAALAAEGMTSVAGLLGDMKAAYRRELGLQPRGNCTKLLYSVFAEKLPSAWFSTSLLGLGLAFGTTSPMGAAVTIASIVTSLATMAPLAYANLLDFTVAGVPTSLAVLSGLLAVAVRLCGALYCGLQEDPALFSLTDGCSQRVG